VWSPAYERFASKRAHTWARPYKQIFIMSVNFLFLQYMKDFYIVNMKFRVFVKTGEVISGVIPMQKRAKESLNKKESLEKRKTKKDIENDSNNDSNNLDGKKSKSENTKDKRRKTKQAENLKTKLYLAIIFLLFIIYILGYSIGLLNREKTPLTTITHGSIDLPKYIDGVIIRDETVYTAEDSGEITYLVKDLEKVRKNSAVVGISDIETVREIEHELTVIDESILKIQGLGNDELSSAQSDAKKINESIKSYVGNQIFDFLSDDFDAVYGVKDSAEKSMNLRNKILIDEIVLSKNSEHSSELLNNGQKNVEISQSGIVSYHVDGFERIFTTENMYDLTEKAITDKSGYKEFTPSSKKVNEGDEIFKLLNSNTWYIGAYFLRDEVRDWQVGSERNIYIENNNDYDRLYIRVHDIIFQDDGKAFVIFKSTKYVLDYIENRFIRFRTSQSEEVGLKVPTSAIKKETVIKVPNEFLLKEDNNVTFAKLKDSDEIRDIIVSVRFEDKNENCSYVIKRFGEIDFGKTLVGIDDTTKTFNIEQDNYLDIYGVYKVNTGIAEFTRVYLKDDKVGTGEYTILDPFANISLKSYDIVTTYADDISDAQRIYRK